jgi:hypothetical protein
MAARAQDYEFAAEILRWAIGSTSARVPTFEEEAAFQPERMQAVVRDLYELGQVQAASLLEQAVDPRGKDCDFVLDPSQIETAIKRLEAFL